MESRQVRLEQHEGKNGVNDAAVQPIFPGEGVPQVLRAGTLDREARALLRFVNLSRSSRSTRNIPLNRMRQGWRLAAMALGRRPRVASVSERVIDGPGGPITLRIFKPRHTSQLLPAFLWCYGGGFVIGDLDSADSICRNIANMAGCISIAVRYRLSPEHDIVASREDVLAAFDWIARNGTALGIDTTRLAIGGDSAGGNLSAAISQEVQRRGGPGLRMQVLVYPATELVDKFPSYEENLNGGYFLTAEGVEMLEGFLAGSLTTLNLHDPWISPRRSPDLSGLPPAVIVTAGFDPIRDDGIDYGMRLRAAGVPVELLHYAGQFHGFLNFDSVIGASRDALRRISEALVCVFHDRPAPDRTIEIADAALPAVQGLSHKAGEMATSTLTAWVATEGWTRTLVRLASPKAASTFRLLLTPLFVPTDFVRRRVIARMDRLAARQTWPGRG
ncbi:alpha/beta hydrolase [Pseudomonas schmalbachii]|uniref:Alpha/beta hydrolase n=1 Tax=Pseudomonas schmalbachii TaxID=2816993 RepID=A0ABS3TZL2_9PSED|nr:alpha/beta hydrolase [Pseudomonas schmalbachii]MBO3278115.1 alpha/beta hydrolase [Pseudomonas schmalbachii]